MKAKTLVLIELVLIVLLLAALVSRYVSFIGTPPVVREPAAPGESRLVYTPPPPPKIQADVVASLATYRKLLKPRVRAVTDDIYLASGFALGNVQMVVTGEGLVIIDTTESRDAAGEILERFRAITDQPIRYVIYTHGHLDHVSGAPVFVGPGTEVIATTRLVDFLRTNFVTLREFQTRARRNQAGDLEPDYAPKLPVRSLFRGLDRLEEPVWPTITFAEEHAFVLGGKRFELYHTTGETPDHLMVWPPDERALFCGDLYYASFPNLSTPMLASRPVEGWYRSLDRMIEMRPEVLIPGHTDPLVGEENVRRVLTAYRDAIHHVYASTLECINAGKSVEEAVATVRLPEDLAGLPWLEELYGRVDWSVRGIYRGLTGWYDGKGTGLNPLPPGYAARETVALAGGADKVLGRAIELQRASEHQLVCELCDLVLRANPGDRLAHQVKANSLEYLAFTSGNLNMWGFYRSAAAVERKAAGVEVP